jgi:hypothetical protein
MRPRSSQDSSSSRSTTRIFPSRPSTVWAGVATIRFANSVVSSLSAGMHGSCSAISVMRSTLPTACRGAQCPPEGGDSPRRHEVLTISRDLLDDSISNPRGLVVKIVGFEAKHLEGSEQDASLRDDVRGNAKAAPLRTARLGQDRQRVKLLPHWRHCSTTSAAMPAPIMLPKVDDQPVREVVEGESQVGLGDQFVHHEVSCCLGVGFGLRPGNSRILEALGIAEGIKGKGHSHSLVLGDGAPAGGGGGLVFLAGVISMAVRTQGRSRTTSAASQLVEKRSLIGFAVRLSSLRPRASIPE